MPDSILSTPSLFSSPHPSVMPKMPEIGKPPKDDETDALTDMPRARQRLFDQVQDAATSLEPVSNTRHTLKLTDVQYHGPDDFSIADQKKAILSGQTLGRTLRGTWQLIDNATGALVDQRRMTLARVPYRTNRGTFIHNGTEYVVRNQLRLRPGIFVRTKENGEIDAHVNVLPGKGVTHHYYLDPENQTFYLKLGGSKTPLLPLLRTLGASDKQVEEAWGPELFAINTAKADPSAVKKLAQKLLRVKDGILPEKYTDLLAERFRSMELDPEVTSRTLGTPYRNLDLNSILDTTKKLLKLSRNEIDPDDRDHMAYQRILTPEDLFSERVKRDSGGVRRDSLFRASRMGKLSAIKSTPFQHELESVLLSSGLGAGPEETNMLELLDKVTAVTRMGVGGIQDSDSIPDESRSLSPSHFGFVDPTRTPESERAGIDLNFASIVRRNKQGYLVSPFKNLHTGQEEWKTAQDIADEAVAFPGELSKTGANRVLVMQRGRTRYVPRDQVKYEFSNFENNFSSLANLIPMKSAVQGQRASMGARMLSQALPLQDAEAPLVRSGVPGSTERSYEEDLGRFAGTVRADKGGVVTNVSPDAITVRYEDGTTQTHELYQSFPFNRRTRLQNTAVVQPGQTIHAGDLLAKSNFTDNQGHIALGRNVRVAFMPHKHGANYEDAIAISESLAKRLLSEHLYQHETDWSDDTSVKGKKSYLGLYPTKFSRQQLDSLDDDGVIKPGTLVKNGDPLVVMARRREFSESRIHKKGQTAHSDGSLTWDLEAPGQVQDVVKTDRGPMVTVTAIRGTQEADKLANRFGAKGVIGKIIPDERMPRGSDGQPFEMLLNPLGVISRRNPAQVVEATLAKIAAIRGRPYVVNDFKDIQSLQEFAAREADRYGVPDTETVFDPETGRHIPGVKTGVQWFMKLHHLSEDKGQGRGTAGGYTMSGAPAKGAEESSKRLSMMETNALLAHGAYNMLRDAKLIRGQKNDQYWLSFMQGHTPAEPRVPFVYEEFINELKGAGINPVRNGTSLNIMALTNKDIDQLSGDREISSGDTVDFDEAMTPINGGLFDKTLTGGHNGTRWTHVKLAEPLPSPVMEEPIRRLLGLTRNKFEDVIAGREKLGETTGPSAIKQALENINLDREIAMARAQIASGRKTARDVAIRKLGYLKSAKKLGIHPADWMLDKVPVLPPAFRPVAKISESKQPIISNANYLYKELIDSNNTVKDLKSEIGDDVGEERLQLYNAFKAVTGLGTPQHPKLQEKNVKGLLQHIWGSSPKHSAIQARLLSTPIDIVGRAVIRPNADLDMDEVGLPEDSAWNVYRNFVIRRLVRKGLPMVQAMEEVRNRSSQAKTELLDELKQRPVVINRAPMLHRLGVLAAWPRLVKGSALHISPLITEPIGGDFDGDQMNYHVPVSDAEVDDAITHMLPSRNLFSSADFKKPVFAPRQEAQAGLYEMTRGDTKGRSLVFRNIRDVMQAYRRGEISIHDEVDVRE